MPPEGVAAVGRPVGCSAAGELNGGAVPCGGAEAGGRTLTGLGSSGTSVASTDEVAPGSAVAGADTAAAEAEADTAAAEAEAVVLAGTCAWLESP